MKTEAPEKTSLRNTPPKREKVPHRGAGDAWRAHQAFQRVRFLCREAKGLESLDVGIGLGSRAAPGGTLESLAAGVLAPKEGT